MNIVNHPLCTTSIGAPSDMPGACSALPVAYQTDVHGTWAVSFWHPTAAELADLVAGGDVMLQVRAPGRQHPVVAVGTYPAPVESTRTPGVAQARMAIATALEKAQSQLIYPPTMTPTLEHVLGFMNFRTGPIAHVFQAAGFPIPKKCEAEQAFVLDRMIRAVIEHGEGWADVFTADLRAQQAIIEEKKAALGRPKNEERHD